MANHWNKMQLFEAADRALSRVQNSEEYEALTYMRRVTSRLLSGRKPHEILGEEVINGLRVSPPSYRGEPE